MEAKINLVNIAIECAQRISKKIGKNDYVIEDECCKLQYEIRKKFNEKITIAVNDLIEKEKSADIDHSYIFDDMKIKLNKIISDL